MPEEIFVLSMIAVVACTFTVIFVVSKIAEHAKSRHESSSGSGSLRTSELESMIRRVVREEIGRSGDGTVDPDREQTRFLSEHLDSDELFDEARKSKPRVRRERID